MNNFIEHWKIKIAASLNGLASDTFDSSQIIAEIPPNPELGDIAFPMFAYAKLLRKSPVQIAQLIFDKLNDRSAEAVGPYLNVRLDRASAAREILAEVLEGGDVCTFGRPQTLAGKKITIEFSSPNTNKPLHLGHLRNNALGESLSRILKACGADVYKLCIINDRGIHICKSMLAYMEAGQGKTPQSEKIKPDHFVGDWYVQFNNMLKEDIKIGYTETQAPYMARAQELLVKWEAGDIETTALWKQMNSWAIEGMKETYKRTGISFDKFDFESENWLLGKEEVLKGLEKGIFYREADGAIAADLSGENLDKKILLRADGTSIYITQDFGTAIKRYETWPFNQMIYVVGSEQQYHFKVLFTLLDKLGYPWAKNLYHLSYGMVKLPDGKMKSREGTVVDADDLIDSLRDMALAQIAEKEREEKVGDPAQVAEKIALGALHYFLLQTDSARDMMFDPKESLAFNGNTGPYLQYLGARISSMFRKKDEEITVNAENFSLLTCDAEWEIIKTLASYPQAVANAAGSLEPSRLAAHLYELSKNFSRFYHECPVLGAEDEKLSNARLCLSKAVLKVLKDALHLINVPFLEAM